MQPIIIEAAISGSKGSSNPNVPASLEELTRDALNCIEAGASVVHNHIDDFAFRGLEAAERYGSVWRPVLEHHPDAILIPTLTAPDIDDPLGPYGHIVATAAAGAGLAPIDPGCVNMTAGRPDGQPDPLRSAAFVNDYASLDRALDLYKEHAIPASISIWDPTFLRAAMAYERADRFVPGSFIKLFFGGGYGYLDGTKGVSFGLPPTVDALRVYLGMMEGSRLPWAAAVLGGDILAETEFARSVVLAGGHLRVGLEDHAGNDTPTNAGLVAQAVDFARELGRLPASFAQAATLLGLQPASMVRRHG